MLCWLVFFSPLCKSSEKLLMLSFRSDTCSCQFWSISLFFLWAFKQPFSLAVLSLSLSLCQAQDSLSGVSKWERRNSVKWLRLEALRVSVSVRTLLVMLYFKSFRFLFNPLLYSLLLCFLWNLGFLDNEKVCVFFSS